ncbi:MULTISPECIES: GNAT family N-acetyltransferase [Legionella]|uniref:GNAT family acetyltransferase n=2 Tax=Legionella TaxID=445 RepID=A0A0W0SAE7_9GAMM|nr:MULTISPECIES: GNAT family N-acetyltransferase [Legionella]KTC80107.1 GNAT family acetyltransferase [Legionella cherrii]MCL9682814.1 GNAT family N-acetyltransferase [Legionella maioricensis]MCL9686558.1 GNAT family N-acetyltransferase [Legionella maioricensis]
MTIKIETPRMLLRLIKDEDLDQVAQLHADREVRKFFPDGTQDREQTKRRITQIMSLYGDKGLPGFVIFNKVTHEFIGRCGFGPIETGEIEVGYLIVRKFWGMGYASEALEALLEWSKININSDYIIAFAPLKHSASHRVMEKCGMEYYKDALGHGVECKFYRSKNK